MSRKPKVATDNYEYKIIRRKDKVAIVGFASHKDRAPFDDPEFEIWGLNELYDHIPIEKAKKEKRVRWFEIHKREGNYEGNPFGSRHNEHVQKLAALGEHCPVYMQKHYDDIPNSVVYPLQLLIDQYTGYYTNSISYMLAMAIHEGFKEIHIYGVDMAQDTEYNTQRPSCEFYIGYAMGRGSTVYLPPDSDLCKTSFLYGYESEKIAALRAKLVPRRDELKKRLEENNRQAQLIRDASNQIQGAVVDVEYVLKAWS